MIDWISMNISTILVAMAVIACIMLVIVKMVREKKAGIHPAPAAEIRPVPKTDSKN